jgi:hypothetical protein
MGLSFQAKNHGFCPFFGSKGAFLTKNHRFRAVSERSSDSLHSSQGLKDDEPALLQ